MNILTESERFSAEELEKIEAHYEATYVCETCPKVGNGWANRFVSIFYQPDPSKVPEGGSQWFGLFFRHLHPVFDDNSRQTLMICNAISAVENDIQGIVANNGDVYQWAVQRWRHRQYPVLEGHR